MIKIKTVILLNKLDVDTRFWFYQMHQPHNPDFFGTDRISEAYREHTKVLNRMQSLIRDAGYECDITDNRLQCSQVFYDDMKTVINRIVKHDEHKKVVNV